MKKLWLLLSLLTGCREIVTVEVEKVVPNPTITLSPRLWLVGDEAFGTAYGAIEGEVQTEARTHFRLFLGQGDFKAKRVWTEGYGYFGTAWRDSTNLTAGLRDSTNTLRANTLMIHFTRTASARYFEVAVYYDWRLIIDGVTKKTESGKLPEGVMATQTNEAALVARTPLGVRASN